MSLRAEPLRDPGDAHAGARLALRPLSQAVPRQIRWLLPGLIPLRFLTLVAGIGGLGKSTWLLAVAARGSVADEPWETIYVSFEDSADEVLRPRLDAAGGNPDLVHELALADAGSLDSFCLPRDIDDLRELVRSRSARLVVIDPVVAAIDTKLDAYKDQHVRQVLAQLWQVSREEDCAIALVGHLNRAPSTDAYLRIANSSAFWNAARSVVLITEDGDGENDLRLVAQRKANLARLAPVERHRLEEILLPEALDAATGKPIVTSRMRFVEIADDVDPSDLLSPQKPTKTENVETLLEALLADGDWHESHTLRALLEAAGFNERMAQRAAKALGVEHRREGFPATSWWRLPPVATRLHSTNVAAGESLYRGRSTVAIPEDMSRLEGDDVATGESLYPSGFGAPRSQSRHRCMRQRVSGLARSSASSVSGSTSQAPTDPAPSPARIASPNGFRPERPRERPPAGASRRRARSRGAARRRAGTRRIGAPGCTASGNRGRRRRGGVSAPVFPGYGSSTMTPQELATRLRRQGHRVNTSHTEGLGDPRASLAPQVARP